MTILGLAIFWIAQVAFLVLWGRVIFDFIRALRPTWKPEGFVLALGVLLYKVTDPPVRWLRKYLKPVRIGQVSLDLAVLVLFVALIVLMNLGRFLVRL